MKNRTHHAFDRVRKGQTLELKYDPAGGSDSHLIPGTAMGALGSDALYDADANPRIDERLDGVDMRRREGDSGFPKLIEIPSEVEQQFPRCKPIAPSLRRDEIAFRARFSMCRQVRHFSLATSSRSSTG
ncbi:hypothetical protein JQ615_07625 [Bradyrhizobium jicamae]|uniref:Uncharacterized protein n=1 Tax=Bradyrhizobium jicamae TaxID=280332 RepID=A0ABS5FEU6_9BRAD|nr:hypothetical protein [Bradyrhizobium jicamae]MBR0795252.1 hypothetical protein [Bradyrhizobium jicamae]